METTTRTVRRWHSSALFAAVFLAFLLPFATVSCNGTQTTFTGVQLVTHTVPHGGTFQDEEGDTWEISDRVEHDGSITATLILVAAAIGLALGIRNVAKGPGWCAAAGLILTVWLDVSAGYADVHIRSGYKLVLLLFVWASTLHMWRAVGRHRERRRAERASPGGQDMGAALEPADHRVDVPEAVGEADLVRVASEALDVPVGLAEQPGGVQ